MDIEQYALPVNDLNAIEKTALELIQAERNGVYLTDEQHDWLTFSDDVLFRAANGYLLTSN